MESSLMKLRLTTCIIVPSSCGSQSCVMPTTRLREDLRVSWDLSLPVTLTCVGTGGHSWIGLMHTSTPGCTSIRHPSCLREVDSEKFNPAMITSRAWISVEKSVEDDNLCWPDQKCGIVSYVQVNSSCCSHFRALSCRKSRRNSIRKPHRPLPS